MGWSALAGSSAAALALAPAATNASGSDGWRPIVDRPWPAIAFTNVRGERITLRQYSGSVVLVEPVGMSCPACNAFAGANEPGARGFGGTTPQRGLQSIRRLASLFGGVSLDDPRLMFVTLILYNLDMRAPSAADARAWAQHFGYSRPNHVVLFGDAALIGPASYNMNQR